MRIETITHNSFTLKSLKLCLHDIATLFFKNESSPYAAKDYGVYIVLAGEVTLERIDKTLTYGKGCMFFTVPGEMLLFTVGPTGATLLKTELSGTNAQRFLEERQTCMSDECTAGDTAHAERFMTDIRSAVSPSFALGCFLQLLSAREPKTNSENNENKAQWKFRYTEMACDYIADHYGLPLTVETIACEVGLNRSYLYRLFMERFGVSVQTYLLNYRLERAAELLTESHLSLREICYACGFAGESNFSKCFSEKYKVSPGKYRSANS